MSVNSKIPAAPGDIPRVAVFLDRDGVLNVAPQVGGLPTAPRSLAEMRVVPGVEDACARLRAAGFLLIVVTNQPDIVRGTTTLAVVEAINSALASRLGLDAVFVCLHDDSDNCDCRKPRPGMLLAAARQWHIDLTNSYLVGDRRRDIEAGRAAGCRTVFVDHHYNEQRPQDVDLFTSSLAQVTPILIAEKAAARTPT